MNVLKLSRFNNHNSLNKFTRTLNYIKLNITYLTNASFTVQITQLMNDRLPAIEPKLLIKANKRLAIPKSIKLSRSCLIASKWFKSFKKVSTKTSILHLKELYNISSQIIEVKSLKPVRSLTSFRDARHKMLILVISYRHQLLKNKL